MANPFDFLKDNRKNDEKKDSKEDKNYSYADIKKEVYGDNHEETPSMPRDDKSEEVRVVNGKIEPEYQEESKTHDESVRTITHKVKNGETVKTLAKLYRVPAEEIKQLNDLKSDNLKPRQKVKINTKNK